MNGYVQIDATPRVIIVESNIAQRRKLVDAITETGLTTQVREAQSVAEGQELLLNERFEICFVGAGLSEATQKTFVSNMTRDGHMLDTVFIPLSKNPEKDKVLEFIQAGAHGVLVVPVQPQALKRVIETAYRAREGHISKKLASKEVVDRLPAQLEEVADMLKQLAEKIKSNNYSGSPEKVIKEALQQTFSYSGDDAEEAAKSISKLAKR